MVKWDLNPCQIMKMYRLQRCRIRQGLLSSTNSTNTTNNELPCNDIICLILLDIYKYCFLQTGRHFYNQKKSLSQFLKFVFFIINKIIVQSYRFSRLPVFRSKFQRTMNLFLTQLCRVLFLYSINNISQICFFKKLLHFKII